MDGKMETPQKAAGYLDYPEYGRNLAWLGREEAESSSAAYRILLSSSLPCLAKCVESSLNGRRLYIYLTESYAALSELSETMRSDEQVRMILHILEAVIRVREDGFLSCRNIDPDPAHLYADPASGDCCLVYIPEENGLAETEAGFEQKLRSHLAEFMVQRHLLDTPVASVLLAGLRNTGVTLRDLVERSRCYYKAAETIRDVPHSSALIRPPGSRSSRSRQL